MNILETGLIVELFVLPSLISNDKKCETRRVSNRADRHHLPQIKIYLYYSQMDYHGSRSD